MAAPGARRPELLPLEDYPVHLRSYAWGISVLVGVLQKARTDASTQGIEPHLRQTLNGFARTADEFVTLINRHLGVGEQRAPLPGRPRIQETSDLSLKDLDIELREDIASWLEECLPASVELPRGAPELSLEVEDACEGILQRVTDAGRQLVDLIQQSKYAPDDVLWPNAGSCASK
jgi:hypothetical protein